MSARACASVAAATLAIGGCGGGDRGSAGQLSWSGEPRVLRPPTLPGDRILSGRVTNDSLEVIELEASDLELVDTSGDMIEANAIFLEGYVKPLESRNRQSQETIDERRRRGLEARIEPGETAPVTVSWHQPREQAPDRIEYGSGSLPLP